MDERRGESQCAAGAAGFGGRAAGLAFLVGSAGPGWRLWLGAQGLTFLERMALEAEATAESSAAVNESHEKESSLREARQTPPMIGTSEA